jgi:hypothetical protein
MFFNIFLSPFFLLRTYNGKERFQNFFSDLETANAKAKEYQSKYGSSDNDENEKKYYDNLMENSLCLYGKTKTKK